MCKMVIFAGIALVSGPGSVSQGGSQKDQPSLPYCTDLLDVDPVTKEIGLTAEEKASIEKVEIESKKGLEPLNPPMGPDTTVESLRLWASTHADLLKHYRDAESKAQKRIVAILTDTQRARLHEITLQLYGARAAADPSVSVQLKLTEPQLVKLRSGLANIHSDPGRGQAIKAASAAAFSSSGDTTTVDFGPGFNGAAQPTVTAGPRGYLKLLIKRDGLLNSILTPGQHLKWQKMLGKTIDLGPWAVIDGL